MAEPNPMRELCLQMITMINAGDFDDYLEVINKTVASRQRQVKLSFVSSLHVGDRIKLVEQIKPQLLANAIAEIVDFEPGGKVKVRLLRTYSPKWRQGGIVHIPPSLIGGRA